MKVGLATLAAYAALVAAAPAHAATPVPWCGTGPEAADRQPDAIQAHSIHVAYVRGFLAPDRFAEWAPRIAGDAAAIDAWWRTQDPTRAPRFDLFPAPAGCASPFGALDITSFELPQAVSGITGAFGAIRSLLASEAGLREPEKAYLVYYDGPTSQAGRDRVCGQGATGSSFGLPGMAIVYLDSCGAATGDAVRVVVAVHELVHVFGAVADAAPNACEDGHVCDDPSDLMTSFLSGGQLETHVLDAARDDYYGHGRPWLDIRRSRFLEALDGADRTPPTVPGAVRAGDDPSGRVRLSWRRSTDDVGPVSYRLYQDERFLREVRGTSLLLGTGGTITAYGVRAVDAAGRLSPVATVRFRDGVGMVDARGRLVRDTVRPPAVTRARAERSRGSVRVSWPAVRDAGGLKGYRVRIGGRSLLVRRPAVVLAVARLTGNVSIAAVDRAGNVGPALTLPRSRLR